MTEIDIFELGTLDRKDFYFTGDDCRYHIEIEAKRRFLELLKDKSNSGVKYKGRAFKWDTIILEKARESGQFLLGKSGSPDFVNPALDLVRIRGQELRGRILGLSAEEARKSGSLRVLLTTYVRKLGVAVHSNHIGRFA